MNNNKILATVARFTSVVFHPLLIPTLGFLLLFNSGFYFSILPWSVKKYMLLIVFLSTCVLPAISIFILSLNPKFDLRMEKNTDRVLAMIFSAISYFLGYQMLRRLPVFPIYSVFMVGAVLVQIALLPISMRWKVSAHAAAIGGLVGGILGLSFRLQHTQSQVYAGFLVGFLILVLVITFI